MTVFQSDTTTSVDKACSSCSPAPGRKPAPGRLFGLGLPACICRRPVTRGVTGVAWIKSGVTGFFREPRSVRIADTCPLEMSFGRGGWIREGRRRGLCRIKYRKKNQWDPRGRPHRHHSIHNWQEAPTSQICQAGESASDSEGSNFPKPPDRMLGCSRQNPIQQPSPVRRQAQFHSTATVDGSRLFVSGPWKTTKAPTA